MKTFAAVTALAAGIAIVGCAVHQQEAPGLSGPSQLALVLTVTATPDTISQDGGSQSSILITATGPNGQLVSGVPIRLDMLVNGVPQDFGTLSARNVVTNSSGAALAVYTAPPTPAGSATPFCQPNPIGAVLPGNCVSIRATPTGTTTAATDLAFTTTIRLVPPGIILPPVKTPKAAFTFVPNSPLVQQPVVFDGQTSCAETDSSGACLTTGAIVSYSWNFGDGSTGSGKSTTHTYSTSGTLPVTLTVTNSGGASASTTQPITVGLPTGPSAKISFSPSAPAVNDPVHFSGEQSTSAPGHNINQYSWEFGDGSATAFGSGRNIDHTYTVAGTYTVNLSVTDDTGQRSVTSVSVTVTTGAPTAVLVITKNGGNNITADGSGSTATGSATITNYAFNFGDGTPVVSSGVASQPHSYVLAGTYTVRLTVTDSLNRTGTTTATVTVP